MIENEAERKKEKKQCERKRKRAKEMEMERVKEEKRGRRKRGRKTINLKSKDNIPLEIANRTSHQSLAENCLSSDIKVNKLKARISNFICLIKCLELFDRKPGRKERVHHNYHFFNLIKKI